MNNKDQKVIRLKQVQAMTGLSRATIYSRISITSKYFDVEFPKPFKLGNGRAIGFLREEIDTWINEKTANRNVISA